MKSLANPILVSHMLQWTISSFGYSSKSTRYRNPIVSTVIGPKNKTNEKELNRNDVTEMVDNEN